MNSKDDQYYINEVVCGNTNAYATLVSRYQDQVYGLALRISGNQLDAEEIAQDAFMKVYKSLRSFKQKSKFSTWLYRIVYNTALSKIRSNKKYNQSVELNSVNQHDLQSTMDTFSGLYNDERSAFLNQALDQLPENEKFLIHLYYVDEKNVKEISEIAEITEDNVKIKLYRIRKKLLQMLSNTLKNEIFDIYGKAK